MDRLSILDQPLSCLQLPRRQRVFLQSRQRLTNPVPLQAICRYVNRSSRAVSALGVDFPTAGATPREEDR